MSSPDDTSHGPQTGSPSSVPAQPVPEPVVPTPAPPVVQETVVVPPIAENPFIPQAAQPAPANGSSHVVPPSTPKKRGGLGKKMIFIVLILLVLGVVGAGIMTALRFVGGGSAVTLTYWGLWENEAVIQNIISDYTTQHPNVTIQYVKQSPKQYRERLQAAIARGDGPDIFRFHNTWVPMLKNELATVSDGPWDVAKFTSAFYPFAARDLVAETKIFGVPLMLDGLGLYYNEDLFAAAGVTPPTTYEELLDIVPKLTVKNESEIFTAGIALGTTNNVEHFSDIFGLMLLQNGAPITNPVGKEAEDTLTFYRKFADPNDPAYTWNATLDNSVYAFANGNVAMILAPSWRAFDILEINPNLRFRIAPVPQLPGNTVSWASYWVEGVSEQSKNQEAAWEFLAYLSSKETLTKFYTEASKTRQFGEIYSRQDMKQLVETDPYVGAYVTQASTAKSFPLASRTFDNGINDRMSKYVEDAINSMSQGNSPDAAMETVAAGFQQVLSGYGLSVGP